VGCLCETLVLKRCDYTKIVGELVALQMLAFVVLFKMQQDCNLDKSE